jgi:hypothetical protein
VDPHQSLNKFRLREIEQELFVELQPARERRRTATTGEEKRIALAAFERALQRFTDFAARKIVPEEFLRD